MPRGIVKPHTAPKSSPFQALSAGPTSGASIFVRFWGVADISRRPGRIAFATVDPIADKGRT
jgi:hypothetical protein